MLAEVPEEFTREIVKRPFAGTLTKFSTVGTFSRLSVYQSSGARSVGEVYGTMNSPVTSVLSEMEVAESQSLFGSWASFSVRIVNVRSARPVKLLYPHMRRSVVEPGPTLT